jgi:hypothetical protein
MCNNSALQPAIELVNGKRKHHNASRGCSAPLLLLLLHDADAAIAAGGAGHADLGFTIRITPALAFNRPCGSENFVPKPALIQPIQCLTLDPVRIAFL